MSPLMSQVHNQIKKANSMNTTGTRRCVAMHPTSSKRICWDVATCVILLYEALALPLTFLDYELPRFQENMAWFTRIFWTADMPLSAFTGYDRADGEVEVRLRKALRRYVRVVDGLLLDLVMVGCDWVLFLMSSTSFVGTARSIKILKAIRVIRVLRTMRIFRLAQLSNKYMPQIRYLTRSVGATVVLGLARVMVLLLITNHFLACCWCWIGKESRLAGDATWLDSTDYLPSLALDETYAVAFHWSLTQFVGSMDVNAQNTGERLYTIGVLLMGFLVMSVVPPTITTLMTTYQNSATENTEVMRQLTDYLQDNNISQNLGVRVQRAAVNSMRVERQKLPEDKVLLLGQITVHLQAEVKYEVFGPLLMSHPFFRRLHDMYPEAFLGICLKAVTRFALAANECMFQAGLLSASPGMLIVKSGRLMYRNELSDEETVLLPGDWVCEASLWTQWVHCGELWAVKDSALLHIDSSLLQEVIGRSSGVNGFKKREPHRYAERFVEKLNELGAEAVTDVYTSDLDVKEMALQVFPQLTRNWSVSAVARTPGGTFASFASSMWSGVSGDCSNSSDSAAWPGLLPWRRG